MRFFDQYNTVATSEISPSLIISELQLIGVIEVPPGHDAHLAHVVDPEVNISSRELLVCIHSSIFVPMMFSNNLGEDNDQAKYHTHHSEESSSYFLNHDRSPIVQSCRSSRSQLP